MQRVDVTYAFYLSEFCCGGEATLPSGEFEKFIRRAKCWASGLGVRFLAEFETEIKLCICEIAEILYSAARSGNIKTESVDGYSVTFENDKSIRTRLREVLALRLGDTGLLYAGVE